ncbi:nuclear transport factor 2-like protein [Kribbella monticola]|uniref:hypothetical protein n=1 Tax=Kribbella monticola TaxID=2185285 RepID=UPI000DD3B8A4|nr:hypothetical protein [Kribbella monticola]
MTDLWMIIESLGRSWTGDRAAMDDLLADDVVIEAPFAAGGPARWDGREEWLAFAVPARAGYPGAVRPVYAVGRVRDDGPRDRRTGV